MKHYLEYMDKVEVSDTLHQRLLHLEAPGKRPIPWKKYGTVAAALILVAGAGGFAAWAAHINSLDSPIPPYPPGFQQVETVDEPNPDIAIAEPGDVTEPGMKTIGGYEVTSGSGPDAMTTYYTLPYIEYGDTGGAEACIDWDVPPGAVKKDLTRADIAALLGGEEAVNTHLNWGGYELTGWAAWYEDGSFWGAYLFGYAGALDHFEFAVTAGSIPPTCIVYPGSTTQEVRGLTVTADKYDGEHGCSRRVSFMKDDYGYRFDLTSTDTEQAELLVSRLVRQIADQGLALGTLSADGAAPAHPYEADPGYSVGEPNWEGGVPEQDDTPAYDPREADPSCNAPN